MSNKLFTTTMPLALFLEKLSLLVASSSISFDVSHVPGKPNEVADALSRWDGFNSPPHDLRSNDRIMLSLPAIWNIDLRPKLFPSDATIPWSLPIVNFSVLDKSLSIRGFLGRPYPWKL